MFQQTYRDVLSCQSRKRPFPITRGIPNLTYFPEGTDETAAFNNTQTECERQTHERVVQDRYERSLGPKAIVELLKQADFETKRLRFWTNLGRKGRSPLKKMLIRMMVS